MRLSLVKFLLILLILITALFYLDIFQKDYMSDDYYFLNNINDISDAFDILTIGFLRPVVRMSFFIEFQIFGKNPFFSHLINLTLHLIAVYLAYQLMWHLYSNQYSALGTAMVFGLHFVQTETVMWVSARSESILFIAGISYILSYLSEWKKLSLLLFLLTLSAKESGFLFYFLLIAVLFSRKKNIRNILKETFPHFVLILLYFCIYYFATVNKPAVFLFDITKVLPSFSSYVSMFLYPEGIAMVFYFVHALIILYLYLNNELDGSILIISMAFFIFPIMFFSFSNQLFYRYRYLYTPHLGFSILTFYTGAKLWCPGPDSISDYNRKALKAIYSVFIFVFMLLNFYNSILLRKDFHKYSSLYSELGRKAVEESTGKRPQVFMLKDFPRTLGRTRLLFLMIEDTIRYYTDSDADVILYREADTVYDILFHRPDIILEGPQSKFSVLTYCRTNNTIKTDSNLAGGFEQLLEYRAGQTIIKVDAYDGIVKDLSGLSTEIFNIEEMKGFFNIIIKANNFLMPPVLCINGLEGAGHVKIINYAGDVIFPKNYDGHIQIYKIKGYIERQLKEIIISYERDISIYYGPECLDLIYDAEKPDTLKRGRKR